MADTDDQPMTDAQYRRARTGDMVVSLRQLSNGNLVIPAGVRLQIEGKHGGFNLLGPRCSCCGVAARISKVPRVAVSAVAS